MCKACVFTIRRSKAGPAQVDQLEGKDLHVLPGAVEKYGRVPLRSGEAGDCTDRKKPQVNSYFEGLDLV